MVYAYLCTKCPCEFDVIKSVKDMDVNEFCPNCEAPGERQFIPKRVFFSGTSVQHAEFNHGLGAVTKNKAHRDELAKRKGLVEVGNDFKSGDTMQTKFDRDREEKRKKGWDDL
jgi:putative FmdB family regulatory protein